VLAAQLTLALKKLFVLPVLPVLPVLLAQC
jgi:hypothetical protein